MLLLSGVSSPSGTTSSELSLRDRSSSRPDTRFRNTDVRAPGPRLPGEPLHGRIKDGKKTYLRIKKSVPVSREVWIGVPFAGIPKEWVLAAREATKDNERVSNCGRRFLEPTGGVLCCEACGGAVARNFITTRVTGYYRCGRRHRLGRCSSRREKNFRAEDAETATPC